MSDSGMRLRIVNEGDSAVEVKYTRVDTAYRLGTEEGISTAHDHEVLSPGEEISLEEVDRILGVEPVVDSDEDDDADDDDDDGVDEDDL